MYTIQQVLYTYIHTLILYNPLPLFVNRDNTNDQIFRGYTGEESHPKWEDAVESTSISS